MSTHTHTSGLVKQLPWLAGLGFYTLFLRPQMLKWGTRLGESQRRLSGDEIVPKPNFQMTSAITIDAPVQALWPWVAQMGRERTGYYGLDLLTNQSIPSVTFIRKDIPDPEIGMEMDGGYHIIELEPDRKLLFGGFNLQRPLGITQDLSWLYLVEQRSDGCIRLLIRQRAFSYGILGPAFNLGYEIASFAHVTRQLQQLKQQAESMAHLARNSH